MIGGDGINDESNKTAPPPIAQYVMLKHLIVTYRSVMARKDITFCHTEITCYMSTSVNDGMERPVTTVPIAAQHHTLIGPDYREENVYPEAYPGLAIIHNSLEEKVKAHWHPGLEFVYSSHGSCPFIVDGQEMPLNTGDLLLINPYSIHYGIPTDADGTTPLVLSVTFNDEVLERLYPFADRYMFSLRAPRATKDDLAQLARLGEDIIRWQQSDEAIRGFKLNMLLYELLSLLYSRFVSEVRRPELVRSGRNITMQIIGYMTSHRKQHLEATDVAREFGYGREHFCRPFRKATGKTFKEFLTDLRLDDACRKLSGSSASIASIARECGFPDTRALQTAVQRKYGIRA